MPFITEETEFYGYISSLAQPSRFENRYEEAAYNEARKKLASFNDIRNLVETLSDFNKEVRTLYN